MELTVNGHGKDLTFDGAGKMVGVEEEVPPGEPGGARSRSHSRSCRKRQAAEAGVGHRERRRLLRSEYSESGKVFGVQSRRQWRPCEVRSSHVAPQRFSSVVGQAILPAAVFSGGAWLQFCCLVGQDCILLAGFFNRPLRVEQSSPEKRRFQSCPATKQSMRQHAVFTAGAAPQPNACKPLARAP